MDYSQLTDRELERRYRETLDQRERTALRRELNTRMRQAYIKEIDPPPSERVNQTSTNKTPASGLDLHWRMATPKHSTNIQTRIRARALCTRCNGTGRARVLFWMQKCPGCGGSGYRSDQIKKIFIILFLLALAFSPIIFFLYMVNR